MGKTYACAFSNCDKIFSKAYELKRHKVTHMAQDRALYRSERNTHTLQKKNFRIHAATHAGEKIHQCPDMINKDGSSGAPRTNDHAALTGHRKKAYEYIPATNRSRYTKAAVRKPHQKKDGKTSRRLRHPALISRRRSKLLRALRPAYGTEYASTPMESSNDPSLISWEGITRSAVPVASSTSYEREAFPSPSELEGDACGQLTGLTTPGAPVHDSFPFHRQDSDAYGQSTNLGPPSAISGPDPLAFGNSSSPHGHFESGIVYDLSLDPRWATMYQRGPIFLDSTGLKHGPQPVPEVSAQPDLDMPGPMCSEWLVEIGAEDWDQEAPNAYDDIYTF